MNEKEHKNEKYTIEKKNTNEKCTNDKYYTNEKVCKWKKMYQSKLYE